MPVARRGRPALPLLLAVPVLLGLALAACDAEPGLPSESVRPVVERVTVTPIRDSLATAAPTATIPLTVDAVVSGEGPLTVRVLVRYQETDSLAGQATTVTEPGPVRVEVPLTLPRGATGVYDVETTIEGPDGRLGDGAKAVFRFAAASLGPPVVTVEDASIAPGSNGTSLLTVTVSVTDPDGLANVIAVGIRQAGTEGIGFRLLDNGPQQGSGADAVADDGRYTEEVAISGAEPGEVELEAVAVDRAGTISAPAPFTVTIQ